MSTLDEVTQTVVHTAYKLGRKIPPPIAARIAKAVLETPGDTLSVEEEVVAELWDIPDFEHPRKMIREQLTRSLAMLVISKGYVPVTLPVETVTRRPYFGSELVTVTMSVPVRRPL